MGAAIVGADGWPHKLKDLQDLTESNAIASIADAYNLPDWKKSHDADLQFQTVRGRTGAARPWVAKALFEEVATLLLNGAPDTARLILRDIVNATVDFEQLAELTHKPSKSLQRMLSQKGNPSMDNLTAIFDAVRGWLKVSFDVQVMEVA